MAQMKADDFPIVHFQYKPKEVELSLSLSVSGTYYFYIKTFPNISFFASTRFLNVSMSYIFDDFVLVLDEKIY